MDQGVTAWDNRLFLEAVFWRVRTGTPWRDTYPLAGARGTASSAPSDGGPPAGYLSACSITCPLALRLLADKAFDNDWLPTALDARGTIAGHAPKG